MKLLLLWIIFIVLMSVSVLDKSKKLSTFLFSKMLRRGGRGRGRDRVRVPVRVHVGYGLHEQRRRRLDVNDCFGRRNGRQNVDDRRQNAGEATQQHSNQCAAGFALLRFVDEDAEENLRDRGHDDAGDEDFGH